MVSARYIKLWRDIVAERGRIALMSLALAVSTAAIGSVLGTWAVLTREIARSYQSSVPAHVTLELPGGVAADTLALVRQNDQVADAQARKVLLSRAHVGRDWRPLLLFVPTHFDELRLNRFTSESGAWPPPIGTLLLERSATTMAEASEGDSLEVKTPHGTPRRLLVSGVVHDAGLAPAWQERSVYGYVTRETLQLLDGSDALDELRVTFKQVPSDLRNAEKSAQALGQWLRARGVEVEQLRVPPPTQHPHQRQMTTILLMLALFAGLALVLSSVLVATSLAAMLARQVREIGVLKTLGARSRQLLALYSLLVGGLALVALGAALPLSFAGARAGASAVADMLNFELVDSTVPAWVFAVQAVSGVLVPLGLAQFPIRRAARTPVRECLDASGVVVNSTASAWLPPVMRNLLRRPKRLALTLLLLATAGALFITALSVSAAWNKNLLKIQQTRYYDVEVRLHEGAQAPTLALERVPGVKAVEWWGYEPAAFAREGEIDTVRTYPDRGHGSLTLLAPPLDTRLISFPLLAGRWLRRGDGDAVVLNHVAAAQGGGVQVGDQVLLSAGAQTYRARVAGIVEEIGSAGVVYMNREAFAARYGELRMARATTLATSEGDRQVVIRRLEQTLSDSAAGVEAVIPFSELRTAVGDHVVILVRALVALASVLALVGVLGLTSAVSTGILERTREIGVMKALGARPGRIMRMVLLESLLTAVVSCCLAFLLTVPLTAGVESIIGRLGFLAPLPFVLSSGAMLAWLALACASSVVSTWLPARRAGAISVREALVQI